MGPGGRPACAPQSFYSDETTWNEVYFDPSVSCASALQLATFSLPVDVAVGNGQYQLNRTVHVNLTTPLYWYVRRPAD